MELSLTGIATRKSRKADFRVSQRLSEMMKSFQDLNIGQKEDYCLMITLIGNNTEHFRVVANSDNIYQVEVGYGDNLEFSSLPNESMDRVLLSATLDACLRVINSYPKFTASENELIHSWFIDWRLIVEEISTK